MTTALGPTAATRITDPDGPAPGQPPVADRLRELVSPLGGLVGGTYRLSAPPGDPPFAVCTATLGDLTQVLPEVRLSTNGRSTAGTIDGAGGSVDEDEASWLCIAEALERYSSCVYSPAQFIWATARELGTDAIDLGSVPRVSDREIKDPDCFVVQPSLDAPMRWVKSMSLLTGRVIWLPVTMVYLHIPYMSWGERFTAPISTGCAAHTDLAVALTKALCEVVERDAIALTWLQQLELPRLVLDTVPGDVERFLATAASTNVTTNLFDATTDIGVPTVYSVESTPRHPSIRTVVMCATDLDMGQAVMKVLREAASARIALRNRTLETSNPADFVSVHHGATYMAAPQRQTAFDFLLNGTRTRRFSALQRHSFGSPEEELAWVVQRLARRGMDAYAVDLSSDEARAVGVHVVRTVVPGLMPLSFISRAQFRGTPRLYTAPAEMGYPVLAESDLNPWPQPFA